MLFRTKKFIICALVIICTLLLAAVGSLCLAPEKQTAHAATSETYYWGVLTTEQKLIISSNQSDVSTADAGKNGTFNSTDKFTAFDLPWGDFKLSDSQGRVYVTRAEVKGTVVPEHLDKWFANFIYLKSVDLSGLHAANIESAQDMFASCDALTTIVTPAALKVGFTLALPGYFEFKSGSKTWLLKEITDEYSNCETLTRHINHTYPDESGVCDCGTPASIKVTSGADASDVKYFDFFDEAQSAADKESGSVIQLLRNVTVPQTIESYHDITLDLNGYMLSLKFNVTGSVIEVKSGTFTLEDTYTGDNKIHNVFDPTAEDSSISITGGVITGGTGSGANKTGGGVLVDQGASFKMNGGTIAGNTANYGGGVRVNEGATFIMNDGTISYNKAANDAGGLCVYKAEKIELNGGYITANTATNGGAIYFEGNGFDKSANTALDNYSLSGVNIAANTATETAGGIYIDGSTVTFSKGVIGGIGAAKNSVSGANGKGGGVYIANTVKNDITEAYAQFTMLGGIISGNTANYGGGVYMDCLNGEFSMSGGYITDNTAKYGGGVCVCNGTFGVSGAVNITDNTNEKSEKDNVCLYYYREITVKGKLEANGNKAQIGYNTVNSKATKGYGANNKDTDGNVIAPNQYFISDKAQCTYLSENEVYCAKHKPVQNNDCTNDTVCSVCGEVMNEGNTQHSWSDSLQSDDAFHWYKCENEGCTQIKEKSGHTYINGECEYCSVKQQYFWGFTTDNKLIITSDEADLADVSDETQKGSFDFDAVFVDAVPPWFNVSGSVISVEVKGSVAPKSTANWFSGCLQMASVDLSGLDVSAVMNMSGMFFYCSAFTSLDLSSFDTSNVTDMNCMFSGCSALTSLDLSSFDTSNVTDMSGIFSGCSELTSLDLSSFDTANVTSMNKMFSNCSALTSLDLSSFDTANVTDKGEMFSNCSALTSLDLSSFDTANVANMYGMFGNCSALTSLDLSSFDTANVTSMNKMFSNCSALTSLDLSSFDTSNVTDIGEMFRNCSVLTSIDLTSFNLSRIANIIHVDSVFTGCDKLKTLKTPSVMSSLPVDLPCEYWNGTKDVTAMTEANKILTRHDEHSYGWVTVTEATCTEDGTKKQVCSLCGYESGTTVAIDALGHTYGEPQWTWTDDGAAASVKFSCSDCTDVVNDSATVTNAVKTAATCTVKGTTTYTAKYMFGGTEYTSTKDVAHIDTVAHDFANGTMYKFDGTQHWKQCKDCTAEDTENKVNHIGGVATCTEKATCSVCQAEYGEVLGHDWDEGEVTSPATCQAKGEKTFKCKRSGCTATGTEEIAIDNTVHGYAEDWTNDSTGHWHAATCEHTSETKDFAAHTAGDWIIDTVAQVGVAGSRHRECTVCGYTTATEAIAALKDELIKPGENGGDNKVVVSYTDGFGAEIELVVTEISEGDLDDYQSVAQTANGEVCFVYDVKLVKNGSESVQPEGTLTIKLLIPVDLRGKSFKLFHLHGSAAADMQYTVSGNYAVVNTDVLSEFVFVGEKAVAPAPEPTPSGGEERKSYVWICWLLIPLAFGASGVAFGVYLYLKKR